MGRVSHMFISGMVQGVGFRYYVYRLANQYRICGFTRNLSNGDVEVYAEGEPKDVEEFARRVRIGPSMASVDRVTEDDTPIQCGSFSIFDILPDE